MESISYLYPAKPAILKDPGAGLDYGFDWSDWLTAIGDTIASAQVTGSAGLTVSNVAHSGGIVTCMVSGGTPGEEASITCQIVTTGPPARTDERTLWLGIAQR